MARKKNSLLLPRYFSCNHSSTEPCTHVCMLTPLSCLSWHETVLSTEDTGSIGHAPEDSGQGLLAGVPRMRGECAGENGVGSGGGVLRSECSTLFSSSLSLTSFTVYLKSAALCSGVHQIVKRCSYQHIHHLRVICFVWQKQLKSANLLKLSNIIKWLSPLF